MGKNQEGLSGFVGELSGFIEVLLSLILHNILNTLCYFRVSVSYTHLTLPTTPYV